MLVVSYIICNMYIACKYSMEISTVLQSVCT